MPAGSDQQSCETANCCWKPAGDGSATPWCFHKKGPGPIPPPPRPGHACSPDLILTGVDSPGGFLQDGFYDKMVALYEKQLDIEGSGAVAAALDHDTPGGSYFYHWMRDGAMSMRVFLEINEVVRRTRRRVVSVVVVLVKIAESPLRKRCRVGLGPRCLHRNNFPVHLLRSNALKMIFSLSYPLVRSRPPPSTTTLPTRCGPMSDG